MTSRRRWAYTLIELLTTIAGLVIILGLMVSLAGDVRRRSADRVTRDLLRALDVALMHYRDDHHGAWPESDPLLPAQVADSSTQPAQPTPEAPEAELLARAERGNIQVMSALVTWSEAKGKPLKDLPLGRAMRGPVRDAWGGPVAFMPQHHPAIGMAGGDRPFFFSPGPDGLYRTRPDNLYSYESAR